MRGASAGLPLHVEIRGTAGRPLVLLHGFGASGFTWRNWLPELEHRYRVVVADLKGHGSAPAPRDGAYAPRDHADAVVRLVEAWDLRQLTLVGHSLGGGVALLVALELAARAPGRLHSLILIEPGALPQELPPFIRLARLPLLGVLLLRLVPSRTLIRWVLRTVVHDPSTVTTEQVEGYAAPLDSADVRYGVSRTARQILPEDVERIVERYGEIRVPTLLLWGRDDPVIPLLQGRRLHEILPCSRLAILDECGHVPQDERPRPSLEAVLSFLDELEEESG
ncbi:MAG: alpha/beta fold hydrolase [Gemmatimonadetes bacterium]|nr:alpha/beta hydrolase [Gemmatimonadota bacterium]NIR78523.1 alpha/beta hydrolase [Gemmatimonadota bacterium]NIT87139.1 alpha/beta hydrolase [Gemmatimonadota bacterium]NIU30976.1 alpha/beta hydrolase [Gemmatimonadota bacterium]NIU35737.1 alpha/beta fold hydrolase [Gemmatimonadota bacterium]